MKLYPKHCLYVTLIFILSVISERSHHVNDFKVAIGEGDGVGWGGNWQHESERGSDGAGEHDVQWVDLDGSGLHKKKTLKGFTYHSNTC